MAIKKRTQKKSKREMKEELDKKNDFQSEKELHTLKWLNYTRKVYGKYLGNRINELNSKIWDKYSERLTKEVLEYDNSPLSLCTHIDEYKKYIRSEISLIKNSFKNKDFYNNPKSEIIKGIHNLIEHAENNLELDQNFGLKSSIISNLTKIEREGSLYIEQKLRFNQLKELVKVERQFHNYLKAYVTKDI